MILCRFILLEFNCFPDHLVGFVSTFHGSLCYDADA
jgi:hypothetical protein